MNPYLSSSNQDLMLLAKQLREKYLAAQPFPSIHIPNFFNEAYLTEVLAEFPDLAKSNSIRYHDPLQKKFAGNGEELFGPKTKALMHYLNSEPFLQFINAITGIEEQLHGDAYFSGAGLHEIKPGGLLKVHADFNKHPVTNLDRRVNFIIYLNKDWKEEYGGHFELWDRDMNNCVNKFTPHFNSIAMFSTTSVSYHGHPNELTCPADRSRKSLALYYYSNGRPAEEHVVIPEGHNSIFVKRQGSNEDSKDWENFDKNSRKKSLARRVYHKFFKR